MSDWSTEADAWLTGLAQRDAAAPPATWNEIAGAAWRAGGLNTFFGADRPTADAYAELEATVKAETGMSAAELTDNWGGKQPPARFSDRAAMIADRLGTLDKGARDAIAPLTDLEARAAEKAAATEEQAASVAERTYGLSGNALLYATGIARSAVDPANLAATVAGTFVGQPEAGFLSLLGREALIGGATVAVQEPTIEARRRALGLEPGNAMFNIAAGALGAAGLAGILRAGATVVRSLRPRAETPLAPADLEAAAGLAERDQVIATQATPPTTVGRQRAVEQIDRAGAVLEASRARPEAPPTDIQAAPPLVPPPEGSPAPAFVEGFAPKHLATIPGDAENIIRPGGARVAVRPAVVELGDLTVSHDLNGNVNPNYPAALQPRDRAAAASRSFISERSAALEPSLLGRSPTAQEGAPVVGPDGVVEAGNGRAMMIARAYDRHPERARAYRQFLTDQGYDIGGFDHPVLVRVRQGEVGDRALFARETNISPTAGLSVRERAFADAHLLTDDILALRQPGETSSAANVAFTRAFAERIVAPEERPAFVGAGDRLSSEGARRIEAALVARAWGAPDVVSALYEEASPTSRAILGAFADTAPTAARVKAAIADGRIKPADDPTPSMLDAFRLVERARGSGQKTGDLVDQIDLERGAVPEEVVAAARLYFRDDALQLAAGRDTVAARIDKALLRALDKQNAVGDLFGTELDTAANLRAARLVGEDLADLPATAAQPGKVTAVAADIGDPALAAEAARLLAELGDDFRIFLVDDATGEVVERSAREALTEAADSEKAVRELVDCIGVATLEAAE